MTRLSSRALELSREAFQAPGLPVIRTIIKQLNSGPRRLDPSCSLGILPHLLPVECRRLEWTNSYLVHTRRSLCRKCHCHKNKYSAYSIFAKGPSPRRSWTKSKVGPLLNIDSVSKQQNRAKIEVFSTTWSYKNRISTVVDSPTSGQKSRRQKETTFRRSQISHGRSIFSPDIPIIVYVVHGIKSYLIQ